MARWATMSISLRRRTPREPDLPGVRGTVRIDERTKVLTKRLKSGEIAVIDHQDIDKVSAEALLACRPVAVINDGFGYYLKLRADDLADPTISLVRSWLIAHFAARQGDSADTE